MATYSINFHNRSTNNWNACVYQKYPDQNRTDIETLAWFSKQCDAGSDCTFSWEIDYCFVWSQTGELIPGVVFGASQTVACDPQNGPNQIILDNNGAFTFGATSTESFEGMLRVVETQNIPLKQGSVGIGMANSGVFAVQAEPNIKVDFTPKPDYWITFGDFQQGVVMDIEQITNIQNLLFDGVFSLDVTLDANNNWIVK